MTKYEGEQLLKLIPGLRDLSYEERLKELDRLPVLRNTSKPIQK